MARLARVVAPGVPHHPPSPRLRRTGLTQRGNRRQDVFFTDADRHKFLSLLADQCGHCGLRADDLLSGDLEQADHVGNWRAWLLDEDDAAVRLLRDRTRTGRPCGPAEFVERLQKLLGRRLTPKKRGRKPKRKKPKAE